jgi:dienelactone hydrolase
MHGTARKFLLGGVMLALLLAPASAVADTPGPHHAFPVFRGGDAAIPMHTVFHPVNLDAVAFRMPIVLWGNGGCRDSNEEFRYFLTRFTSYGYFVVANGKPENPYHPEELDKLLDPKPERLIEGLEWALKQNADPASRLYQRLDPARVVVMGQSCGGWETVDASADKRVTSSVVWNSGTNGHHPQGIVDLHAPVLFAHGGNSDYVMADAIASYHAAQVPAVLAGHADAGHTGFFDDPSDGTPAPGPFQDEPLPVAANWLAFTLYGSPAGRAYFLGDPCGLCQKPSWTVESKNWAGYARERSDAPGVERAPTATPKACTVRVRLRRSYRSATVYVNGRRAGTIRRARRVRVRVSGRTTLRVVGRAKGGRRASERRTLKGCA